MHMTLVAEENQSKPYSNFINSLRAADTLSLKFYSFLAIHASIPILLYHTVNGITNGLKRY